jgi:hypothetical protein
MMVTWLLDRQHHHLKPRLRSGQDVELSMTERLFVEIMAGKSKKPV